MRTRMLPIGFVVVGVLVTCYLLWALHRSGSAIVTDSHWPRAWPYPDEWLMRWHDRLDAAHPASPGALKIHGELPRLHFYLWCSIGLSSLVAVLSFVWLRFLRLRGRDA